MQKSIEMRMLDFLRVIENNKEHSGCKLVTLHNPPYANVIMAVLNKMGVSSQGRWLAIESPSGGLVMRVIAECRKYYSHKPKKHKDKAKKTVIIKNADGLEKYKPVDLINELRKRGYKGTLIFEHKITL